MIWSKMLSIVCFHWQLSALLDAALATQLTPVSDLQTSLDVSRESFNHSETFVAPDENFLPV